MTRLATMLLLVLLATPAEAQLPTIDAASVAQATMIAERTLRTYEQLVKQRELLTTMAKRGSGREQYATPPVRQGSHDVARYSGAVVRSILSALNSGDPAGILYRVAVSTLPQLAVSHDRIDRHAAAIYASDAVTGRAAHEAGALREHSADLGRAIAALQRDAIRPANGPALTEVLDTVAGAEIVGRQQTQVTNELLTQLVAERVIDARRWREAEAETHRLRVGSARPERWDAIGSTWASWRQP